MCPPTPPTWECNFLMSAVSEEHPFTKFYLLRIVRIQGVDKCSQKQETEKEEDFHVSTEDTPVITKQFKNIISRSQILIKIVLLIIKELILKFMISQQNERTAPLIFDNGPTFPE